MRTFSKFEMATIKRTAASVKSFIKKRDKLNGQIAELMTNVESLNKVIDCFEAPIKEMSGGFTSSEILSRIDNNAEEAPVVDGEENYNNEESIPFNVNND